MRRILLAAVIALTSAASAFAETPALQIQKDQSTLTNRCYPNGPVQHDAGLQQLCREASERIAQNKAIMAEQQRLFAIEQAKRDKIALEEAKAKAIEDAKPVNVIFRAYTMYIFASVCNEIREGYLVKYVNDVELEKAKVAVKAIVAKAKEQQPDVDTDLAWKEAQKEHDRLGNLTGHSIDYCQRQLNSLINASPVPLYGPAKPE